MVPRSQQKARSLRKSFEDFGTVDFYMVSDLLICPFSLLLICLLIIF